MPIKVTEEVKELYNELTPRSKKRITNPKKNSGGNAVSRETEEFVKTFYEDDSNSPITPDKKDVLSDRNKENNAKEKARKRLLLEDIEKLHKNYNNQHPNNQIGKPKFFELRPTWVIPVQKQSQDVRKCVYHENIDLICTALVNFARSKKLELNFKNISSADSIWKLTVCDIYEKDSVWRNCENCSCEKINDEFQPLESHMEDEITVS